MHIRISEAVKAELTVTAKAQGIAPGTYARSLIIKGLKAEAKKGAK